MLNNPFFACLLAARATQDRQSNPPGSCPTLACRVLASATSIIQRGDIGSAVDRATRHVLPPAAYHEYQMCKA
eukprot:10809535-Karenia_brevis.AAC.1